MADINLNDLVTNNPVLSSDVLTGDEPIETEIGSQSRGAKLSQLSVTPINEVTAASYILAVTDQSKAVAVNRTTSHTLTVPNNTTVPFPINGTVIVRRIGAGSVTFTAAGGVTINKRASAGLDIAEQWGQVVLHKTGANEWYIEGGLTTI